MNKPAVRTEFDTLATAWEAIVEASLQLDNEVTALANTGSYCDSVILKELRNEIVDARRAAVATLLAQHGWTEFDFDAEISRRAELALGASL